MWLIRFHLIETRDYNKIDRIFHGLDFLPRKISTMLCIKGIILHLLDNKSWRRIAEQLSIPYLTLYHLFHQLRNTAQLKTLFSYLIERRIILFIGDEKNINEAFLLSDEIIERSLNEISFLLSGE